ncbi:response regulator transcription factor [Seongchinamella unica]|uniref:Response regulator transcription factor n=1 Tax=Seongchinamella unica TaxID=2547392 RepID=A0A4R5LUU3_9GAMM|nr:LytTR family DNA-binding domain-containing protein [Seongchinamella unica]TDG15193.1 response regulator transcription factor [Seongchinamella unica]
MRKLRTIVVDDEPLARRLMRSMLSDIDDIELVAECRNGREAVAAVQGFAPDLMLLDIKMPGLSGFDVVRELQADIMPMVIFCTAYQRYALDAFDLHAVDYLLKPVDEGRLQRAVARARQRFETETEAQNKTPLIGAIDEIAHKVASRGPNAGKSPAPEGVVTESRKLAIKDHDGTVLVSVDDIDWVDAAGDYMCIHVGGETHIMRSTLKHLMSRLDPEKFKRIHRSTVVNLERIVKATPLQKGEFTLDLDCGEKLKVSRNYRQEIKIYLDDN